jgi:thiol-disulfide isomerase/thioredoxin
MLPKQVMGKWKIAPMYQNNTITDRTRRLGVGCSTVPSAGLFRFALFTLLLVSSLITSAADFTFEDLHGKSYRLADYRGKWVLVNFWATWCTPCLSEIPELTDLYNAHKNKDLLVIGIAMDSGSSKKVADFVQAHGISYPVVMGERKTIAQIGEIDVLPTSYLYNPKGELVSYQAGEVTRASVEAYILKKQITK